MDIYLSVGQGRCKLVIMADRVWIDRNEETVWRGTVDELAEKVSPRPYHTVGASMAKFGDD